ncbi:MAG: PD-(D/E)XK nuclease family protein [Longicatena sp.]
MDFTQLPMNSILIAPSHMHALIREQIVKEKKGMVGLRIFSPIQFISSYFYEEIPSMHTSLFTIKKHISPLKAHMKTYPSIAETAPFLEECYQFYNAITYWNIPIEQLPQNTQAQLELYDILKTFGDIQVPAHKYISFLDKIESLSFHQVYTIDTYYSLEDQHIIQKLLTKDAKLIEQTLYTCEKQFYHAVNKRQEVEACAQYIIHSNLQAEDIHITLCDTTYQPLLKQIFERYQIPITLLHQQHTSPIVNRFLSLFKLYLNYDNEHLLACFDAGLFLHKHTHALREYLQVFSCAFDTPFHHVNEIQESGNVIDEITLEKLKQLEMQAKEVQEELWNTLTSIKNAPSIPSLLIEIVNIIKETLVSTEDRAMFMQITTLLQELHPYIKRDGDISFMLYFIEKMNVSQTPKEYQGILVHSLSDEIINKKYHFLLGANQSNYPAFQVKKGIFDEPYYALIQGYPSMEERFQHHQQQLSKLLCTSSNIIISYASGTYEGKGLECALEIEQFMNVDSISYPVHENYMEIPLQDHIDEETAHQLFLKDNTLHGSISSLERYVKCPFSYFLRYGLSLREPMKPGFPDSYAGTLSHYILETLINTSGKRYTENATEIISKIIASEVGALQTLFPSMEDALTNVKYRLLQSMIQTIHVLDDYEKHSSLSPSRCEMPFDYEIPLDDYVLALHGYIDRIDESREFACILDYKSSVKTLSETNVFAALQLQLLTYSMVIAKETGKDILGAYYISLKNENITYPAGSMSRRKPVTHNINSKDDMEIERKKARRFNGWTMHKEVAQIDDDASHIVGISASKDGLIKARKLYDLHSIQKYFTQMYQMIGHKILHGDIALTPLEDACTYCDYHEICRFKGYYTDKVQWVEPEDDLYQKGADENA